MAHDTRLPYPGLRSYESEESDLFFGREGCVDAMLERLAKTRFLAVLGTSGSGKSSLVRTGLLDALELGFLPGRNSSDWSIVDIHPGGRPMHNLAAALVDLDGDEKNEIELNLMKSFLTRGPKSLVQWCDDHGLTSDQSILLIVDQFEELFRYRDYAGREEAEAFVALLLQSSKIDPRIHVVITMRSEFLGACAMIPGLADQINLGLYLTPRMTRDECERAIEGPSRVIGFNVEPRLVSEILNDMASLAPWEHDDALTSLEQLARRADQLPLMQHVLNRLYERAKANDGLVELKYSDYQAIGRLRGAIDAHAEEILSSINPESNSIAEPVFRSLISGTNLSNAVREARRFEDLLEIAGGDTKTVVSLLDAFRAQGCSFLRPPPNFKLEPDTIIDLGHESLIRQWTKLGDWLGDEAQDASTWSRIVAAQTAWDKREGELLSGLDLANAQSWWSSTQPTKAWSQRYSGDYERVKIFQEESVKAEELIRSNIEDTERVRLRQLKIRAAAYLGLAVVSVGAALFGFNASNNERIARREAVAAFDSAEIALNQARDANNLAISASETFLIDMTERLRRSFGIKPDDVDQMLHEGTVYLDRLDEQMPDNTSLRRARAKLLLEYSWVSYDRSDYQGSLAHLEEARQLFTEVEFFEPEDALVLVEVEALSSGNFRRLDSHEQGLEFAERARVLMDQFGQRLSTSDRAFGEFLVSNALSLTLNELEQYEEALGISQSCLELYGNVREKKRVLSERAICAVSHVYALNASEQTLTRDKLELLDGHVSVLRDEERDLRDWRNWILFKQQVAFAQYLENDYAATETIHKSIETELNDLIASAPYNDRLRGDRAKSYAALSHLQYLRGEFNKSLDFSLQRISDMETLGSKLKSDPTFAEQYRDALNDTYATISKIESWSENPNRLALAAEIAGKWHQHALFMHNAGIEMCEGCGFVPAGFVTQVAEFQLEMGDEQAATTLLETFDDMREVVNSLDLETNTKIERLQALRMFFWTATDLPSSSTDREAFEDSELAIAAFEASIQRAEYFIENYPQAREVRHTAATAYAELAKLYNEAGRMQDASTAVRRGVQLDGFEATNLLLTWAKSGDGPIAQNSVLASELSELLAAREWSPFVANVNVDELWTEEVENEPATLFIRDLPLNSDSSLDIALDEMKTLIGREVSAVSLSRLKEWERQAKENQETFVRFLYRQITNDGNVDPEGASEIEFRLRNLSEENKVMDAAVVVARQYNVEAKRPELTRALKALLRNQLETGYASLLDFMNQVALVLGQNNAYEHGITVLDVIMENADVIPVKKQLELLELRSQLYDAVGDSEAALKDYLLSLALQPDNYVMLNAVGYQLAEDDSTLPIAMSFLERAMASEPIDSGTRQFVMDSLGWAYVRSGQIERGLELLKEAFILGDDDQAEIMFHIGEAHRRLGSNERAVAAYLLASEYLGSAVVHNDIQTALNRLGYFPNFTSDEVKQIKEIYDARSHIALSSDVAVDSERVALEGIDTVALYLDGKLVRGSPAYWTIYNNAVWLFSTSENLVKFKQDPDRYSPEFGGFCGSCLAATNTKMPGAISGWTITNQKLYLHLSKQDADNWNKAPETYLVKAETAWNSVKDQPSSHTKQSRIAPVLNAIALNTKIQLRDEHPTFASEVEVEEARTALAKLDGKLPLSNVSTDRSGVAIGGFDTVAYHTEGAALRGSFNHWALWQGAVWLFANEANRILFETEPEKYVPLFGGHCAHCLVTDDKSHGDPRYWFIADNQLVLADSEQSQSSWNETYVKNLEETLRKWSELKDVDVQSFGRASRYAAMFSALKRGIDTPAVEW